MDARMPNVAVSLKDEELESYAETLKALGSPVRLRILLMLAETKRPLHIKAVAKNLGLDYAAVYRHVETLKRARLLEVYEVGRSRVLTPTRPESLKAFLQLLGPPSEKAA
ncbi:MAG: winged helix-turn-helix domain-containing protein [Candidatus Bathyarchaeia archaeon]